jgi:protein KTI12
MPCCGKTKFSNNLADYLQNSGNDVVLINEESEHIRKDIGYKSSYAEKSTRGSLKSAVNHQLNANIIVIIDSMNYIKGFRYELFCIARSLRTPHCVCWVETDDEASVAWNKERIANQGDGYEADM